MNRTINFNHDLVISLSQRANQHIDYLNTNYSVISTSKDISNIDRDTINAMANVAQVEQIIRENSANNNEVEKLLPLQIIQGNYRISILQILLSYH